MQSSHCQRSCIASLDGLENMAFLWLDTVGGGIEGTWRAARAGTSQATIDYPESRESFGGCTVHGTVSRSLAYALLLLYGFLRPTHLVPYSLWSAYILQPYMKSAMQDTRTRPAPKPRPTRADPRVRRNRVARNSEQYTRYISSTPCTDRVHTYITYLSN